MGTTLMEEDRMRVLKRSGAYEHISFDKVLQRIRRSAKGLPVNPDALAQQVLGQIYDGVKTEEIDDLTAQLAASLSTNDPAWGILASRIAISNHQKKTSSSFSSVMKALGNQKSPKTGEQLTFIHQKILDVLKDPVKEVKINSYIDYHRDFLFDYFGFKTLERAYLLKDAKRTVLERPQHLWMRVALALWPENLERAFETYDLLSTKKFTHATPTLFAAGTPREQLSSCFLIAMKGDSVKEIFDTLGECAMISKYAGGIGLHVHNIRAKGSGIRGTNGVSDGLAPMLRVFNNTARYINQGGKRNGSFAIYLEPWHADIEDFIKMKMPTGAEEERARDLFYALWIPDLFMKRVQENGSWSLFCPDEAPGLADVYGDEFEELYTRYEKEGRARRVVEAQKLWFQILDAQMETGTPYLTYKDAANKKSNQKNLGVIKSSNLCVAPETPILTDKGYYPIHELEDQEVNVWNGDKWSKTIVRKTGIQQKLISVRLSNGAEIHCTPYHKFIIRESYSDKKSIKDALRVDASELKEGMKLSKFELPLLEGNPDEDIPHPYTHGFFCGDGTTNWNYSKTSKTKICSLYGDKKRLIPYLAIQSTSGKEDASGRINTTLDQSIPDK